MAGKDELRTTRCWARWRWSGVDSAKLQTEQSDVQEQYKQQDYVIAGALVRDVLYVGIGNVHKQMLEG